MQGKQNIKSATWQGFSVKQMAMYLDLCILNDYTVGDQPAKYIYNLSVSFLMSLHLSILTVLFHNEFDRIERNDAPI